LTLFERHIIRRLLAGYLMLVAALVVFFIVLHFIEYMDEFLDRGATLREVFLSYYPRYVPQIVTLTSPLALFLSVIYVTGRLAQEVQLVALQTSGVSLYRLLRPVAIVAVAITGFMFYFNGWVAPQANSFVLEFERQYLRNAPRQIDFNDIHRQNRPGSIVTVGYYNREAAIAHRVALHEFDEARRLTFRIDASRMEWVDSTRTWRIHSAVVRKFEPDGFETRRQVASLDTTLNVLPRDFARSERDVESMTVPVAGEYIEALRRSGAANIEPALVAYYGKFAYPLANLILVLIGFPLASVRRRGGQAAQIGIGIAIAFVYLVAQKLIEPFGYHGVLTPAAAAWLPHLLFAALAIVMIATVRK
jgi:lipopolysaccharide export system permease protein